MSLLLTILEPLWILCIVMTIAGIFKERGTLGGVYSLVKSTVKSKRGMVTLISFVFGVVPITSRISFACSMLDALQDKAKNNQKMGTIAYLASHHYYLWSPIEKSVVIVCGILGISYLQFMQVMWIPALIAIVFSVVYIFTSVTEDEISLKEIPSIEKGSIFDILGLAIAIALAAVYSPIVVYSLYIAMLISIHNRFSFKWIDLSVLAYAGGATLLGVLIGQQTSWLTEFIKSFLDSQGIVAICILAYGVSLLLGSSAKFAAIAGLLTKLFGLKYLPVFYLVEYAGYLISPSHKCVAIGKVYFKTPAGMYFLPIILLSIILIIYAVLYTALGV